MLIQAFMRRALMKRVPPPHGPYWFQRRVWVRVLPSVRRPGPPWWFHLVWGVPLGMFFMDLAPRLAPHAGTASIVLLGIVVGTIQVMRARAVLTLGPAAYAKAEDEELAALTGHEKMEYARHVRVETSSVQNTKRA